MIKGVCRRVIVVRSPDTKLFEQAIFLLRDDAPGVTDAQVLRQACQAADDYVRRHAEPKKIPRRRWRGIVMLLLGALATGAAWVLSAVLFSP